MTREQYESLKLEPLRGIARNRGLKGCSKMKKAELIDAMLLMDSAGERAEEAPSARTESASAAENATMAPGPYKAESASVAENAAVAPDSVKAESAPAAEKAAMAPEFVKAESAPAAEKAAAASDSVKAESVPTPEKAASVPGSSRTGDTPVEAGSENLPSSDIAEKAPSRRRGRPKKDRAASSEGRSAEAGAAGPGGEKRTEKGPAGALDGAEEKSPAPAPKTKTEAGKTGKTGKTAEKEGTKASREQKKTGRSDKAVSERANSKTGPETAAEQRKTGKPDRYTSSKSVEATDSRNTAEKKNGRPLRQAAGKSAGKPAPGASAEPKRIGPPLRNASGKTADNASGRKAGQKQKPGAHGAARTDLSSSDVHSGASASADRRKAAPQPLPAPEEAGRPVASRPDAMPEETRAVIPSGTETAANEAFSPAHASDTAPVKAFSTENSPIRAASSPEEVPGEAEAKDLPKAEPAEKSVSSPGPDSQTEAAKELPEADSAPDFILPLESEPSIDTEKAVPEPEFGQKAISSPGSGNEASPTEEPPEAEPASPVSALSSDSLPESTGPAETASSPREISDEQSVRDSASPAEPGPVAARDSASPAEPGPEATRDNASPVKPGPEAVRDSASPAEPGPEASPRPQQEGQERPGQRTLYFTNNSSSTRGVLEVLPDGFGFLRGANFLSGEDDVYVSPSQIRRFNLKTGDMIEGIKRDKGIGDKNGALLFVSTVNDFTPDQARRRPSFENMTPVFPYERIRLEQPGGSTATRIVDLISPIGKGQRGMIVSPPKAGKTTLLKDIAKSILTGDPDAHLIILLVDERPEEVTDMKESVTGRNVEVIYSTFDEQPEHHMRVAEMVIERARRLVEHRQDVIILLDSITRLTRAYNLLVPPSGRTLSGGLDPAALYAPKRFFGAARKMREGGSLTILATALVDTGSKMDDVVYEEFKGTGNMELILDRKLQERRIFPAIDITRSGTRREDLLLSPDELKAVYFMRRRMNGAKPEEAIENILNAFARSRNNEQVVNSVLAKWSEPPRS